MAQTTLEKKNILSLKGQIIIKSIFFSIVVHVFCLKHQMSQGLLCESNSIAKPFDLFEHFRGTTVFKGDQWALIV